jgi:hypothetical protein
VLHYKGVEDGPWKPSMSSLNVIPSGVRGVSLNLRDISVHLRELKLTNTVVSYGLLCPLEKDGQPKLGTLHLSWPNLETLEVESVPPWLPSGKTSVPSRIRVQ